MSAGLILGGVQTANQIGLEIADLISSTGCGDTCRTASAVSNTADTLFAIVSQDYWGMPAPRPMSAKNAAIAYMNAIEKWFITQCANPALGDAGVRCVRERTGGGCVPGCPHTCGTTGDQCCCNYETNFKNPIINDAAVYDDSAAPVGLSQNGGAIVLPSTGLVLNGGGGIVQAGSGASSVGDYSGMPGSGSGYGFQQPQHTPPISAQSSSISLPLIAAVIGAGLLLLLFMKGDL